MRLFPAFALFSAFTLQVKTVWCQTLQYAGEQKILASQQSSEGEKIYIHTDKEFYVAGETIWFRVFCVDGNFKPTSTSSGQWSMRPTAALRKTATRPTR